MWTSEVDKQLAAEADDRGNIRDLIDDDIVEDEGLIMFHCSIIWTAYNDFHTIRWSPFS